MDTFKASQIIGKAKRRSVNFDIMIDFDDFSPSDDIGIVKATVHQNGKIGFSDGARKLLELENNRYYRVSKNASDAADTNLYLIPTVETDEKAFKVSKAGDYFYLRVKHILDKLGIDYKENRVTFDIKEQIAENSKYYKLKMRPLKKRN